MRPVFEINHVSFSYHTLQGETPALINLTFDVKPGEFIAIVGPSGCGKSTLLNLMSGMLVPEFGDIFLNGKRLNKDNRRQIGYMLQQDYLLEWRSILKNVLLGLEIRGERSPQTVARARKMLAQYGLEKFENARPHELSGGMRQRAALVRTLILNPQLLLLDEPFSALDYQTRLDVSNDIGSIIKEQKKTAILVTHDLAEAVSLADRILVLSRRPGRLVRIVPVKMPSELTPLERRDHVAFKDYFNEIWNDLHQENDKKEWNETCKTDMKYEMGKKSNPEESEHEKDTV